MDKVMKRLDIEIVKLCNKGIKIVVHYNTLGSLVGDGRNNWLKTL
jgi:hypothetical protein